jgi:hypothetical protein
MHKNLSPGDTIAAATIIAGQIAGNPGTWGKETYPQIAHRCVELGAEIAKAREEKERDFKK